MTKKILLFILLIGFVFLFVACDEDVDLLEITNVKFKDGNSLFQFDLDSFKLEQIKLEVEYDDKTRKIISVNRSMLSDADFDALFTTNNYFIDINYEGFTMQATIQMSANVDQPRLPQVVVYSLKEVIDGKTIHSFYTTSTGNYVSYYLVLNHNLSNHDISTSNEKGVFSRSIEESKLKIVHSFGEVITGKNKLFYIESDDNVNFTFSAAESIFYEYNNQVFEITDIKYYSR